MHEVPRFYADLSEHLGRYQPELMIVIETLEVPSVFRTLISIFDKAIEKFDTMAIPTFNSSVPLFAILVVLYCGYLVTYRLYFSSAAKFPGPKLAALTFFYEFYYDAWLEGQYTWKIQDLHKKYGM